MCLHGKRFITIYVIVGLVVCLEKKKKQLYADLMQYSVIGFLHNVNV